MGRRRERQIWGDTPLAKLFIDEARWAEVRPRHLVESVKSELTAQLSDTAKLHRYVEREETRAKTRWPSETPDEHQLRQLKKLRECKATRKQLAAQPSTLREVFDQVDKNADGAIDRVELQDLLQSLQLPFRAEDLSAMIKLFDRNNDNRIDYGEFETLLWQELDTADEEDQQWACTQPHCFSLQTDPPLLNDGLNELCAYCTAPRHGVEDEPDYVPSGKWECANCSFHNPDSVYYCDMCGHPKPSD